MRALLVLAMVATGCGSFERISGQDAAEQLVWHELYGMENPPPQVEWHFSSERNATLEGGTWIGWKVDVTVRVNSDGSMATAAIGSSTFAHELMHYKHWLETGDVDPLHIRADWKLVDTARAALIRRGL